MTAIRAWSKFWRTALGSDGTRFRPRTSLASGFRAIINKRFPDYQSFAGKTIDQLFKPEELRDAQELEVNKFESVYLENREGSFVVHDLPWQAQVSKLFNLTVTDIDGDGPARFAGRGQLHRRQSLSGALRFQLRAGVAEQGQGSSLSFFLPLTLVSAWMVKSGI